MQRDIVEELKALADETRLRILCLLWEAEDLCSCEIEKILDLKQSNASRHLYRLRNAGLLDSYKRAQWTHYRIAMKHYDPQSLAGQVIRTALDEAGSPYTSDIARFRDYRKRGFTCTTIHKWIPFELEQQKHTKELS